MGITQICKKNVVTVTKDCSVVEAAELMRKNHVGDLIVIEVRNEKPVPVGIITDRDIVTSVISQRVDLNAVSVEDVMTPDPVALHEDQGVYDAISAMESSGANRLPVVDQHGSLVGIITSGDLFDLLTHELSSLSRVSQRQHEREQGIRS
jgi:CBS domain-containing protein